MQSRSAEAARYALMRRLLPVLRHHMVVHLQPIGMIYEVLDRKLAAPAPALEPVREGLGKINTLARSAVDSCLDVVTWLAPEPLASASVGQCVEECLGLLRSNFMFRGFTISNHVGDVPQQVRQSALREVTTAALMAMTDAAQTPVELSVRFELLQKQAVLSLEARPVEGSGFTTDMAYRALQWDDVEVLARAHGVGVEHENGSMRLTFAVLA